jgi:DNA modification methylase
LWKLGEHRLLCGDSTKAEDVERLMQGERAALMWTDPPYGVNYVGKTADALTIENDGAEGLPALLAGAFAQATDALKPGSPFYIAHPPGALCIAFGQAILEAGWRFHQTLIWCKDAMVLGHSDYHFQHEPIYYGWTQGEGRSGRGNHDGTRWQGDHSQVSVFHVDRPKRSEEHPTSKPVELVGQMVSNSSRPGDAVYEPFGGSGSTLIACEQLARRARVLELSAHYADVILARWEAATGKQAELLERLT